MKRVIFQAGGLVVASLLFCTSACNKNSNTPSLDSEKHKIVTGDWQQSDILLAVSVSVKVGNTKYSFPAGTSMITDKNLTALGVTANFTPTSKNIYHFTDSGSYRVDGITKVILPVAGSQGKWSLTVYDAVLSLSPVDSVKDAHWINNISDTSLSLAMTVNIPGLGAAPLSLQLLKKQ